MLYLWQWSELVLIAVIFYLLPGAIVYDSDPGSGGGAIAMNVHGTLTIGRELRIYYPKLTITLRMR